MTPDSDATPTPPFAVRYLTHLVKGGYLWTVLGVGALQLLLGRDVAVVLWGGLAAGIVLAMIAAWNLRRLERLSTFRPRDVSEGETVDDHLPRFALTPPDALENLRGGQVVWSAFLVLSGAALAWGWSVIIHFGPSDLSELVLFIVVIAGTVAFAVLAPMSVPVQVVLARNARLVADRPGSLVLTAWFGFVETVTTGTILRRVTSDTQTWWQARVRSFETVVVDADGIGFWRGGARPQLQHQLPWHLIGPVEMAPASIGSSPGQTGVFVSARVVEDGETGWLQIEFVPTRASIWMAFMYTSHDAVSAFARSIEARRPHRSGWFQGLSFGEWRAQFEDARAEGILDGAVVEELLAEIRRWPDQQRAENAWVPSLLAELREEASPLDDVGALRAEAQAWQRR